MRIVKTWYFRKVAVALILTILAMGCIPAKSMAYMMGGAHSTTGVAAFERSADMDRLQRVLESKIISARLTDAGYTATEINSKLQKLSDQELHQFSAQVNNLYPGGDGGLSVLAALLVIVIIVLVVLKMTDRKIIIK
ncbi:MAG: PA2779 family protein [Deltaproteobacteria bacterium]|nr:PA2779 family protein [Deltaproteobacteria bacterium]